MGVAEYLAHRCKMSIADIPACASPAPTIDKYPSARDITYFIHRAEIATMIEQPFGYHDPAADQALLEAVVNNGDARFFIIRPKQFAYTLWSADPPDYIKAKIEQVRCVIFDLVVDPCVLYVSASFVFTSSDRTG